MTQTLTLTEEQKMELAKALEPAADVDPDSQMPFDVSLFACLVISRDTRNSFWTKNEQNREI